jgi:hypothetical protein
MKIHPEDFAVLKAGIDRLRRENPTVTLEHYREHGFTARRYRWDCLWSARDRGYLSEIQKPYSTHFAWRVALDDAHLDTALRKICGHKATG